MALILVCKLRIYRTYNLTVKILKYEFNNNLFGSVTLFRVIPGVTWIQFNIFTYIYIYIYICMYVCMHPNLSTLKNREQKC